ncbi:hypothetical protein GPECTOR_10g962 [Gonium pectorale]|uniref:DOMON domain-containing protein n=1 Tax=Gonium pectorale TaxID=33097 RepID=A0A150GSM8_GONPE|nr:hypothetical protein GPECTOR_10g962 [Gonium pectorale]|eukprot:KXZ52330.1 hypothetical protein GPECTOR_10g962 [Gonium pectorale]
MQLDSNVVLHWRTIDGKTLELAPDGDGYLSWFALGISESGMKGVDFNVIIRGMEGLSWIMGDYFTIDYTMPTLDMEQNAVLTVSPDFDKDNHTLAIWQRPLDSCDTEDTAVYRNVERSLIWAYSYRSNWDQDKFRFSNFTKGIVTGVRLFNSPAVSSGANATGATANTTASPLIPADAVTLTVAMPGYPVPALNSSVACVNLPLPNATAYHVVAYKGFSTSPLVSRISGYVCAAGVVPAGPAAMGVAYPCGPGGPAVGQNLLPVGCETINFVWAPGAQTFTAPAEAGFAIGAGAATTLVLQVHYQNPTGVIGRSDSSGLELTYTPTLRNATLGVLTLGNTDMRIPPATERYTALPNICPASCTGQRVKAPVTLVSNFYMMGRLGESTLTRHIRNGSAIQPVGRINYWDMQYGGFQTTFPESRTLLANDTLISLCTYNSTAVPRSTTFYGLKPTDELCFNFVTFYPVSAMPDLDYCIADTRKNITTCATRSQLARMAALNATDAVQLMNGTKMPVGTLNISFYRSKECVLHDQIDVTPYHKPNTGAAVASVVLVPVVLVIIGYILYSKYSKQEELEALLARARQEGLESILTAN